MASNYANVIDYRVGVVISREMLNDCTFLFDEPDDMQSLFNLADEARDAQAG